MRWIFLTLVLLNVLFILLEVSEGLDRDKRQESYLAESVHGRLLLLGESSPLFASGGSDNIDSLCMLVGPLNSALAAKRLMKELEVPPLRVQVINQPVIKAPNYWVYLPPYENRKTAITKLKSLQAAKVDSYLITQGELANGISLGVFENIDSARKLLERRERQGYNAKIKELGKKDFNHWVFVEGDNAVELRVKVSKTIEEVKNSIGMRQISCKSVASENKLP